MKVKMTDLSEETIKTICKDIHRIGSERLFSEEEKEIYGVNSDSIKLTAELLIESNSEGFVKQFLEENGDIELHVEMGYDEDLNEEFR